MGDDHTFLKAVRALDDAIGEAYDALYLNDVGSAAMLTAWRPLAALLEARPGLRLRAVEARMWRESLAMFVADVIRWLEIDLRQDEALVPVLRGVCELVLARVTPEDRELRVMARAAWVRALDWSDERLGAEAELAAWVHDEPGCARAWATWSALHFEPGYVTGPEDDPQRARALLEQGLRHVVDLEGRNALLSQLGNLLTQLGHADEARAAHEEAMRIHEVLCFGHPLTGRGAAA